MAKANSGRRRTRKTHTMALTFDPEPSVRFAHRVLSETRTLGALIGRVAVWAWLEDSGEHEFTKDVDIAVERTGLQVIRASLAKEGLRTRELGIGGINVCYPDQGVNVDFIDRTNNEYGDLGALFGEAVRAARRAKSFVKVGTTKLALAPAEHLVAMKIGTGEAKDETDAERLLEHADVDVPAVCELVRRHLGAPGIGRLNAILRRIGHPDAPSKRKYEP